MNATVDSTSDVRWRWRSTAAFGSPVVPLVKRRTAMPSGSTKSPSAGSVGGRRARGLPAGTDAAAAIAPGRAGNGPRRPGRRRGAGGEESGQLVAGQPVVARHERDAGQPGPEEEGRDD